MMMMFMTHQSLVHAIVLADEPGACLQFLWWASFCIPTTEIPHSGQMHSHVSCFTFLCLWRDFTDLNTVWHKSHIFSVSVSSLLTSSTTSIWRFSSSILISSSSILTSSSSSILSRISGLVDDSATATDLGKDEETTLVTVMEGPRCGNDPDCDGWWRSSISNEHWWPGPGYRSRRYHTAVTLMRMRMK